MLVRSDPGLALGMGGGEGARQGEENGRSKACACMAGPSRWLGRPRAAHEREGWGSPRGLGLVVVSVSTAASS